MMFKKFAVLKMFGYALNSLCLLVSVCCYAKIVFALGHPDQAARVGPPTTTKWQNDTEHATVQKDRIYSNVHSVNISGMLSAVQFSFSDSYN